MAKLAPRNAAQSRGGVSGLLQEVGPEKKKYRIISNTGFFFIERPGFLNDDALLNASALCFVGDFV